MKWVVRVWSLPTDQNGFRVLCEPPVIDASVTDRNDANGTGTIKVPADYDKLHLILRSDPTNLSQSASSVIAFHRVENGRVLQVPDVEFFAEEANYELADGQRIVTISGPTIRAGLDDAIVAPHPDLVDWIWGGDNAIQDLSLAALGNIQETWMFYLERERYGLKINDATEGQIRFTYDGDTSDPVSHNPSASAIKAAIEGLDGINEVYVLKHEDESFTIVILNPTKLDGDLAVGAVPDSGFDGSLDFDKHAEGFDSNADPEPAFFVLVDTGNGEEQTEAFPWNVAAPTLEGDKVGTPTGIAGLPSVNDVIVTGHGHFGSPFEVVFVDPPKIRSFRVDFSAGDVVTQRQVVGRVDPSPLTRSKPVDAGAGDEEQYGKYGTPDIEVITDPSLQDAESEWVLRVNSQGIYAGSQLIVTVEPGMTYQASIRVRPTVTGLYTLVIRDLAGNLIAQPSPRDNLLQAGFFQQISIRNVRIPENVDQVIFRVAVTDPDPDTWAPFYVNWHTGAQLRIGMEATTIGEIAGTLVEDVQARGLLEYLQLGFDEEHDSASVEWDDADLSWRADVGERMAEHQVRGWWDIGYESELVRLSEPFVDGKTHELRLYNPGNMGQVSDQAIVDGVFEGGQVASRRLAATHVLVEDDSGSHHWVTDPALSGLPRREQFLRAEYAPNEVTARRAGAEVLKQHIRNIYATRIVLTGDTVVPYRDFRVGWTVPYKVGQASAHDRRVHSITLRKQDDDWSAEIAASDLYPAGEGQVPAAVWEAIRRLYAEFKRKRHPKKTGGSGRTAIPVGAHVSLVAGEAQEIPDSTDTPLQMTDRGLQIPLNFTIGALPTSVVTIQEPGYYNVDVGFAFEDSYNAGGRVWVTRTTSGNEFQVYPPASDPGLWSSEGGRRFEGTAHAVECFSGDELRVYVRQESGSAVDITSAWLNVYLVDRIIPRSAGAPPVDVAVRGPQETNTVYDAPLPSAAPGDLLFLMVTAVETFSAPGWTGPDGWGDPVLQSTHGNGRTRYYMKVAGEGEGTTATVTASGLSIFSSIAWVVRNSGEVDWTVEEPDMALASGLTAPAVSPSHGVGRYLSFVALGGRESFGHSGPDGYTPLAEQDANPAGVDPVNYLASREYVTGGVVSPGTIARQDAFSGETVVATILVKVGPG